MISKIKSLLLLFVMCTGSILQASKPSMVNSSSGSAGGGSGSRGSNVFSGIHVNVFSNNPSSSGTKQTGTHSNFKEHQVWYHAPEDPNTAQAPSLSPAELQSIADGYGIGWRGFNQNPVHYIDTHSTTPSDPNLRATESEATRGVGTGSRSAANSNSGSQSSGGSAPTQNTPFQGYSSSHGYEAGSGGAGLYGINFEDHGFAATLQVIGGVADYFKTPQSSHQSVPAQSKSEAEAARTSSNQGASKNTATAAAASAHKKTSTTQENEDDNNSNNHVVDPDKEEYEATVYKCQEREQRQAHGYVLYLNGLSDIELAQEAQALQAKLAHIKQHYVRLNGNITLPRGLERQRFAKTRLDAAEKLYGFARKEAYAKEVALRVHESEYAVLEASLAACYKQQTESKKIFDERYAHEKAEQEEFLKNNSHTTWQLEADRKIADYGKSIADCDVEIKNIKKQLAEVEGKIGAFDGYHPVKKGWAFVKGLIWSSEHYTSLNNDLRHLQEELGARQARLVLLKNNILVLQKLKAEKSVLPKAHVEASSVVNQGQNKGQGESSAHAQLTANQRYLILQSNLEVTVFEQSRSNEAQNLIFKRLNDALAIAADAQAKVANAQRMDPYNQAVAILCAMSHTHHQQGRIGDAQKACGLAQALAQTIVANNDASNSGIANIVQDIGSCIGQAIQQIRDNDLLTSLKDKWIAFKNNQSANIRKELSLLFGVMGAGTVPAGSGPIAGAETLSLAFESILADQVVAMRAVSAAALDPRPPLFRAIDEALLKSVEQMSADSKNQGAGNKDKNTGSAGSGGSAAGNKLEHQHGVYKDAPYHVIKTSGKSPAPKNGQKALDNSILIKDESPSRVSIEGDNFVMLRRTRDGQVPEFHGNIQSWAELDIDAQNALKKAGICNNKGKILKVMV